MGVGHAVLDVGGPGHEGWRGQGPAFEDVGNSLAGNIASQVQQRANAIIAQNTAILQSDLQNQITQGVTTRVLENWASAPHSVSDFLSDKELSNVFRDDEALTANWTPGLQQFCRVCPPAGWPLASPKRVALSRTAFRCSFVRLPVISLIASFMIVWLSERPRTFSNWYCSTPVLG
jgi:hypothetical protein